MHKYKILIVEDNSIIAMSIKNFLIDLGYAITDITDCYDDSLRSIDNESPDIILLDIGLKGSKNGIELAKTIQKKYQIPFIYLTSDNHDETIKSAAHTNPSAYLPKPIRQEELKANILLTLQKNKTQNRLQNLGKRYTYDVFNHNIFHNQKPIHLSPREKLLLSILINGKNSIVPFNIIIEYIWGDEPPIADSALRNILSSLRSKLHHFTIETHSHIGYQLHIDD